MNFLQKTFNYFELKSNESGWSLQVQVTGSNSVNVFLGIGLPCLAKGAMLWKSYGIMLIQPFGFV